MSSILPALPAALPSTPEPGGLGGPTGPPDPRGMGSFSSVLRGPANGVAVGSARPGVNGLPFPAGPRANRVLLGSRGEGDDTSTELHAASRHMAQLAPPATAGTSAPSIEGAPSPLSSSTPSSPMAAPAHPSLEELIPSFLRRIAWSGGARQGSLRLEIGAGAFSGATVLVQSDGGQLHVTLGPARDQAQGDVDAWRDRIAARLKARGLDVAAVEVE